MASLRSGELPPVPTDQREVVVVPCESAEQAVTRTVQLVTSSLPRLLGSVAPLVLTVREAGEAGVGALRETLADTEVVTVATAVGRRAPAVVLVLPGEAAGSLSRALLISALNVVGEHVSIVHQAGPALVSAVERRPHRPRLTRLPALLRSMC